MLDVTVVVLATWTVVYHVCLLLRLDVRWAVGLEVLALAGWGGLSWRAYHRRAGSSQARELVEVAPDRTTRAEATTTDLVLIVTTVASGMAAAGLTAVNGSWGAVAALWLIAAAAGTVWAVLRLTRAGAADPPGHEVEAVGPRRLTDTVVALAWATALAVLSMFTLWPNPDDLYYVNLSQWVVDHGTFPLRDTIFSDLVFPMSSWPPMASYDALMGTLARLVGVHAASVVYLFVPPVATFLSVLALWRLLRAWRVKAVGVALSVGLVFLLFDGGPGYAAPGNLFLIRLWQGKVILLCLLLPLLLVYALRYVERPTRVHAWWLFAGGAAAVGLTTSAMFLVPLVALAGAAPLILRQPGRALLGFAAMGVYPLAAGAVTVAVGGHSADMFESRGPVRFDPAWFGHEIFRDGPLALIAVFAVLMGALLIPHPSARVTTGLLTFVTGVTFVPGVTHLSFDLVGLGPTLWRVSWVASIAALIGVLAARMATYRTRRSLQAAGPLALVLALVLFGLPIWSERNNVSLKQPPHWQRGPESIVSAQQAIDAASPGDVILAPEELAITIDVLTTRVKTVAPRDYFMDYLRDEPGFHYAERLTLIEFTDRRIAGADEAEVARALTLLDVDLVCLPNQARGRISFLLAQEYRPATTSASDTCLKR
ncbi:MAG: hypothetical protein H0V49_04075 [Nocardioidaceae bacterium]|nr:hypothetical protein [Nocardioidaceae bacterium]